VFPTELRGSGINFAAVVSMVVGMSAPYAIDLVNIVLSKSFFVAVKINHKNKFTWLYFLLIENQ
jgi:hypothetical protein